MRTRVATNAVRNTMQIFILQIKKYENAIYYVNGISKRPQLLLAQEYPEKIKEMATQILRICRGHALSLM